MRLLSEITQRQEAVIEQFEAAWAEGKQPNIADVLECTLGSAANRALLGELIPIDIEWRRRRGMSVDLAAYCRQFPALADDPELMRELEQAARASSMEGSRPLRERAFEGSRPFSTQAATAAPGSFEPRKLGRFDLLEQIGEGSFATVYRAWDTTLHRSVAIKLPHAGRFADEECRRRFQREARGVALLNHLGIVPVYELGAEDRLAFIVSEYVPGETLADALAKQAFAAAEAGEIVAQIAEALAHAHRQQVVHRDLKPTNILLHPLECVSGETPQDSTPSRNGPAGISSQVRAKRALRRPALSFRARITDFGLARLAEADASLTREGQFLGTPAYMSPEQAAGRADAVDPRSDIFTVGVLFYELLTGMRPFVGSGEVLLRRIQLDEPVPPTRVSPSVPRDLETICLKCLRKQRQQRYASAAELADDLRRWQQREPILARPASAWERAAAYARRRPARVVSAAFAAALALLALVAVRMHVSRLAREVERADKSAQSARDHAVDARRHMYSAYMLLAGDARTEEMGARVKDLVTPFADDPLIGDQRDWEWHFLRRAMQQELRVVRVAERPLRALAASADGALIAAGAAGGGIAVIQTATGEVLRSWSAGSSDVSSVAFSHDGATLIVGDLGGRLSLWDVHTGRKLRDLTSRQVMIVSAAVAANGAIACAASDGLTHVWRSADDRQPIAIQAEFEPHHQLAFTPDGRRVIAKSASAGSIVVFDASTGDKLATLLSREEPSTCMAVNPAGMLLASGTSDGTVRLVDLRSSEIVDTFSATRGQVKHLAFRSDGTRLAAASEIGAARIWDLSSNKLIATLTGQSAAVAAIQYVPGTCFVASADMDGYVRIWCDQDPTPQPSLPNIVRAYNVRFVDDEEVVSCWTNGLCQLRRPGAAVLPRGKYFTDEDGVTAMTFDPHTRRVARGTYYGGVVVSDWDSAKSCYSFIGDSGYISGMAFDPTGRYLAVVGGANRCIHMFDAATGAPFCTLGRDEQNGPDFLQMMCVAFSGDGTRIAALDRSGWLQIWDLPARKIMLGAQDHAAEPWCVSFSPDGKLLATSGEDALIHVWDVDRKQLVRRLAGHHGYVRSVAFHPSGRRLASGSDDGTVRIWNPHSGDLVTTLASEHGDVRALAFDRSGDRLVTAHRRGTVQLWDAGSPRPDERSRREAEALAGYLHAAAGDPAGARERLAATRASTPEVRRVAAEQLDELEQHQAAADPADEGPWRLRAESLQIVEQSGLSAEEYQRALDMAQIAYRALPDDPWVCLTLGQALLRTGQFDQAEKLLVQAQRVGEDDRHGDVGVAELIICRHRLGLVDQARAEFSQLLEGVRADPGPAAPWLLEADLEVRGPDVELPGPWHLEFYAWNEQDDSSGPLDPDLVFREPRLAVMDVDELHLEWGRGAPAPGVPKDYFAVAATSILHLPPGPIEFVIVGLWPRVLLDGQLLSKPGAPWTSWTLVDWPGGAHTLRVECFYGVAEARMHVRARPVLPGP